MQNPQEIFTASLQQRSFWSGGNRADSPRLVEALFEISSTVSSEEIASALQTVTQRHEILRTRLAPLPDGGVGQLIQPEPPGDLLVYREVDTDQLDFEACGALEPCPGDDLPFSASLLSSRKSSRRWLRLCASLAVCDVESIELIGRELEALLAGQSLKGEPLQYADYAAWQEEAGQSLGTERPDPDGSSQIVLPGELNSSEGRPAWSQIRRSARPDIFTAQQALVFWAAYLSRLTGFESISILKTSRLTGELEAAQAVGPYSVTQAGTFNFSEATSFSEALANSPRFEPVVAGSGRFLFETWKAPAQSLLRLVEICKSHCGERLALMIGETPSELLLQLRFDCARFPAESARRLLDGFITFAERAMSNPAATIRHAPLVGPEEREWLISKPQGPRITFDAPRRIERLFEQAVLQSPDALAVVCGSESLTYAVLNQRANQLAHHLQKLGAGPETCVGLATRRSVEMVVGILGILKSGAAYVPLDPGYPAARLQGMIEEAQLRLIVTTHGVELPSHNAQTVRLGSDDLAINAEPPSNPAGEGEEGQLAYIIFTSGSTGKPKGVMITHSGLILSTLARTHCYPGKVENYLLVSSFSFDSSVAGIFWTLSQGGTLTLPEEGLHQDPDELARLIESESVTHFLALPSLYSAALDRARDLSSLRVAIVAGEACPPELVRRHRAKAPRAGLYNEYGPTEATVWSTVFRCDTAEPSGTVPIGQPIPNWQVFICDEGLNLCPVGVSGELLVGGLGLARGYLNRPELTREKFIPNPFTPEHSPTLYRTGDLARLRPDGNLEFLGRMDHQVKVRGFRIELGEIEAALRAQPGVGECIVVAREDGPGGRQLAAYLTSTAGALEMDEIRAALGRQLPDYMVPSAFVQLDKLPLNPNGKVDRQALPAPSRTRSTAPAGELSPRESEVARIFCSLLRLESVGPDENFFIIGGNSLLAMQLISRVRDQFQADISLRALFDAPTVRGVAKALERAAPAARPAPIKRAQRASARTLLEAEGAAT